MRLTGVWKVRLWAWLSGMGIALISWGREREKEGEGKASREGQPRQWADLLFPNKG